MLIENEARQIHDVCSLSCKQRTDHPGSLQLQTTFEAKVRSSCYISESMANKQIILAILIYMLTLNQRDDVHRTHWISCGCCADHHGCFRLYGHFEGKRAYPSFVICVIQAVKVNDEGFSFHSSAIIDVITNIRMMISVEKTVNFKVEVGHFCIRSSSYGVF